MCLLNPLAVEPDPADDGLEKFDWACGEVARLVILLPSNEPIRCNLLTLFGCLLS
jgi:hypothetical protein